MKETVFFQKPLHIVTFIFIFLLSARFSFSQNDEKKIIGKWEYDRETTLKANSECILCEAFAHDGQTPPGLSIEFRQDNSFIGIETGEDGSQAVFNGTWYIEITELTTKEELESSKNANPRLQYALQGEKLVELHLISDGNNDRLAINKLDGNGLWLFDIGCYTIFKKTEK